LVVLAWDPATRMLGAVTGVVNPKTGAIIPIADVEAITAAGLDGFNPNSTTVLQSFCTTGILRGRFEVRGDGDLRRS